MPISILLVGRMPLLAINKELRMSKRKKKEDIKPTAAALVSRYVSENPTVASDSVSNTALFYRVAAHSILGTIEGGTSAQKELASSIVIQPTASSTFRFSDRNSGSTDEKRGCVRFGETAYHSRSRCAAVVGMTEDHVRTCIWSLVVAALGSVSGVHVFSNRGRKVNEERFNQYLPMGLTVKLNDDGQKRSSVAAIRGTIDADGSELVKACIAEIMSGARFDAIVTSSKSSSASARASFTGDDLEKLRAVLDDAATGGCAFATHLKTLLPPN